MTRRAYSPGYNQDDDDMDDDELDDEWGDDDELDDDDFDDLVEAQAHFARRRLCCRYPFRWRRAFFSEEPEGAKRRLWVLDMPCRDDNALLQSHLVRKGQGLVLVDRQQLEMLDEWADQVTLEEVHAWRAAGRLDG